MCGGPEIALIAAAGASVADTALSTRRASVAKREAEYRAALLNRQEERARQEAKAEAALVRRRSARETARLRARLAAAGVDTAAGTPLLALETLAADRELDALTAINKGEARAGNLSAQAEFERYRGRREKQQIYAGLAGRTLRRTLTLP